MLGIVALAGAVDMSYFLVVWGDNEPTITPDAGVYFEPLACCDPFVQQCVRYLVGYDGNGGAWLVCGARTANMVSDMQARFQSDPQEDSVDLAWLIKELVAQGSRLLLWWAGVCTDKRKDLLRAVSDANGMVAVVLAQQEAGGNVCVYCRPANPPS